MPESPIHEEPPVIQHPTSASAQHRAGGGGGGGLHGSKTNLTSSSKHGSRVNIGHAASVGGAAPPAVGEGQVPPANAIVFENTYRIKPDKKFQSEVVRRITDEILKSRLTKTKYSYDTVPELTQSISNEIMAAVKKLEYDRYKFVVDVTIGEFKGQGIRVASRAIWDTATDSYVSASFKNATLFAVAMVFGCYYE
ncbi:Tctex-1 family-domain-containing protein [Gaertneriomyces semiglobifer]|nr:Tctex-1 family-domain-containing protein [Gaertneriomyces semiglobifer]